ISPRKITAALTSPVNPLSRGCFTSRNVATMLPVRPRRNAPGALYASVAVCGAHRRWIFAYSAVLPTRRSGRWRRDRRPLEPNHVSLGRRHAALPLAGLDRAARLHHAAGHLSPADDGAELVLAALL